MSSKKVKTPKNSGLKVQTALQAGKIALNHNTRPRSAAQAPSKARTLTQKDVAQPRGGVPVRTGIRSGAKGKLK